MPLNKRSKKHIERKLSKSIQIREETQTNSKRLLLLTKFCPTEIRGKFMIDTERRASKVEAVVVLKTSSPKCSVEAWAEDQEVQRRERACNTPLK